jgi:hypothetical protein
MSSVNRIMKCRVIAINLHYLYFSLGEHINSFKYLHLNILRHMCVHDSETISFTFPLCMQS